jgi:hypothetical protein
VAAGYHLVQTAGVAKTREPEEAGQAATPQILQSGHHTPVSQHIVQGDGASKGPALPGNGGVQVHQVNAVPLEPLQAGFRGTCYLAWYLVNVLQLNTYFRGKEGTDPQFLEYPTEIFLGLTVAVLGRRVDPVYAMVQGPAHRL